MAELKIESLREFADAAKAEIEKRYGVSVELSECKKNNRATMLALAIAEGDENIRPSIYMESYFEMYKKQGFEAVIDAIWEVYESNRIREHLDMSVVTDYGRAKHLLRAWIINYGMNKDALRAIPHRRYMDLAIVAYLDIQNIGLGETGGTIWVNDEIKRMWGVTDDEIIDRALCTVRRDVVIMNMKDCLTQSGVDIDAETRGCDKGDRMFVLTNKKQFRGAIGMTDMATLRIVAKTVNRAKIYILPSSIHEVILYFTEDESDIAELYNLVGQVNRDVVEPGFILSNNVYVYDAERDELTIA